MGAGCSSTHSSAQVKTTSQSTVAPAALGARPGHIFLSYHPADTGDPRAEGGDGAAGRVRDWLASRGYVVTLGEPDPDAGACGGVVEGPTAVVAAPPPRIGPVASRRGGVGVQSGLELSWHVRMQQCVERCQAFIALVSERYGSRPEAVREVTAADTALAAGAAMLLPLWHSGPWPPQRLSLEPLLAPLPRVPRGPRPLCRTILEGVMGELLERLQAEGCMPAPKAAPAGAAAAAMAAGAAGAAAPPVAAGAGGTGLDAAAGVAPAPSLDWCFAPGPSDPADSDYVVVRCYTGKLQELADRLALTVRPTVLDLGGETFSGDLPLLEAAPPQYGGGVFAAVDAGAPASGGSLLMSHPHVTLRNGALLLRPNQELRVLGAGAVLDCVTVMTEPRQGGPRGVALGAAGAITVHTWPSGWLAVPPPPCATAISPPPREVPAPGCETPAAPWSHRRVCLAAPGARVCGWRRAGEPSWRGAAWSTRGSTAGRWWAAARGCGRTSVWCRVARRA